MSFETTEEDSLAGQLEDGLTAAVDVERDHAMATVREQLFGAAELLRIGRFTIVDRIGAGGMGIVLAAYDSQLDRKVALKIVQGGRGPGVGHDRLLREAQAMARVSHPNVIPVYEVGEFEGQVFLAMEYVRGCDLRAWWSKEKRPWLAVLDVFLQAGRGLAGAHAVGLVHRDFKPENALVGDDGRVRVLDFGLARATTTAHATTAVAPDSIVDTPVLDTPLTRSGTLLGTPAYMAPEQLEGETADERSDQFSFCVALYEALYGVRPFAGATLPALVHSVTAGTMRQPPLEEPIPRRLRAVIHRGLSLDPQARHPSIEALLIALEQCRPTRSRKRWAMAAAGAAVALGAWSQLGAIEPDACNGALARLSGVWDGGQRVAVRQAFAATGLAYADATVRKVEQRLDDYTGRWARSYRGACEATHVHGEQSQRLLDLRMDCLSDRLVSVTETVELMASADAAIVERSIDAVGGLPSLGLCSDLDGLEARVRPPDDEATHQAVTDLRAQLKHAVALRSAGRYTESLSVAENVVDATASLDYRPIQAEALQVRGSVERLLGNNRGAERSLSEAFWLARASNHDEVVTSAAPVLAYVVGYVQARPDEGETWARHAQAEAERPGAAAVVAARVAHVRGAIAVRRADLDGARRSYERALVLFEEAEGPDSPTALDISSSLGSVAALGGDYDAAAQHFERALARAEDVFGPSHPKLTTKLRNLAEARERQGDYDEAIALYQRAIAIAEDVGGDHDPGLSDALAGVASIYRAQGRYDQAQTLAERALAIEEQAFGPEHPALAASLNTLALIAEARDDEVTARRALERALSIMHAALGEDHPEAAPLFNNLGELELGTGNPAAAESNYRKALAVRERKHGPRHPGLAFSLTGIGTSRIALHDPVAAIAPLERALWLREANRLEAQDLAATRFALAQALWDSRRDRERALALAQSARRGFADFMYGESKSLAEVEAWLEAHTPGR